MSEKHRPRFQCWKCQRTFHQTVEIGDDPVLLLECPFCGAQARVDLNPYRNATDDVLRHGDSGLELQELQLPDTIPTQPRK